jgi:hypothetical protein
MDNRSGIEQGRVKTDLAFYYSLAGEFPSGPFRSIKFRAEVLVRENNILYLDVDRREQKGRDFSFEAFIGGFFNRP